MLFNLEDIDSKTNREGLLFFDFVNNSTTFFANSLLRDLPGIPAPLIQENFKIFYSILSHPTFNIQGEDRLKFEKCSIEISDRSPSALNAGKFA